MDCTEQQQEQGEVMEVPEIDGDVLEEILDASFAAGAEETDEEATGTGPQLDFTADVFDGWVESHELNSIHPHHDCEDCGLNGGVPSDFDLDRCGCSGSGHVTHVVFDDDTTQWTETAEAALGPFIGDEGMGEWYMDGMAMEWEDEDEESGFPFEPYSHGSEAGTEQVYGSPLWE